MAKGIRPKIGITAGDINGIGYEIILKSMLDRYLLNVCTPIIYGSAQIAKQYVSLLKIEGEKIPARIVTSPTAVKENQVNFINCYNENTPLQVGVPTAESGKAALISLQKATDDMKAGLLDAMVTAPLSKQNIPTTDFPFTGHTEFLTRHFSEDGTSLMLLVSNALKVALATNHISIKDVPQKLTTEQIVSKIELLHATLQQDFSIREPRIAVLALNPHAGDNGLFGDEEERIIKPAIQIAKEKDILAFGPYSADGFFGMAHYQRFDAVLAMYHDQGLIPFKSLDMEGVNFTAGLSIIRTSPDHGTAYDLVGKNKASFQSFKNAVYLAIELYKTRKQNIELSQNALKVVPSPKTSAPIINLEEELADK